MKLLLSSLLILSVLAVGISQAEVYAEMVSIETDKPQYFIGDEIKITVIVDENDNTSVTINMGLSNDIPA